MKALQIGLIGDRDDAITAHRAIPAALQLASEHLRRPVEHDWLATDAMPGGAELSRFDALWCVPGSPYRDMDAALRAIRHARERRVPFLGTCGGFQHAVIEVARNVLGWADAEHAETAPDAPRAVVSLLECSLVEAVDVVRLMPGSRIAAAYGSERATEGYRCRYGLNPAFRAQLIGGPLRATAFDAAGEVRAIELADHPFFVCTLFQPERAALRGDMPPLVLALLEAAGRS
jgi:CTP synthase (UTP-ammonia lyase)